jgi:hypothetical protein
MVRCPRGGPSVRPAGDGLYTLVVLTAVAVAVVVVVAIAMTPPSAQRGRNNRSIDGIAQFLTPFINRNLVELVGIEPTTSSLSLSLRTMR